MPWNSTCPEDERAAFVKACYRGEEDMAATCRRFGISRRTGYKWRDRHEAEGQPGLRDRRRTPRHNPQAMAGKVVSELLAVRRRHPSWGPRKVRAWLEQRRPDQRWPAASTIGELFDRAGLTVSRRRRRRAVAAAQPFDAVDGPNEVWAIDFKGWFRTGDGERCDPLTITDVFSRYLVRCQVVERCDLEHVWPIIEAAFREFGLPARMRSDNGPPFAGTGPAGLSRLAVRLIKAGVRPERIAAGKPQQNGRHERFHLTLKQDTANPPAPSVRAQSRRFAAFHRVYNEERPHEALNQATPASCYAVSSRRYRGVLREPVYATDCVVRRVRKNGEIKWAGVNLFISQALSGERVGLQTQDDGVTAVYFADILLGHANLVRRRLTRQQAPKRRRRRPVDMMDSAGALPTSPQAQQPQPQA
jgi:transposase InsO family protein